MKASELIGLLKKEIKDNGDLDIVIYSEHGNNFEPIGSITTKPLFAMNNYHLYGLTTYANKGQELTDHEHYICLSE